MSDFENSFYYHHLTPFTLDNKELYLRASFDIEHSFTGLVNVMGLHNFFIESALEIRNSIKLFEEGFKDAAFYSVRTAVETARIVTLFSTHESPTETEIYQAWRSGGKFPFDSKIKQEIKDASHAFNEVYEAIPDFFEGQSARLQRIQKYIHKQGYKSFYWVGLTSPDQRQNRATMITSDFDEFIKHCLVEIALLRLCIDPFPLLLNDPNVRRRIHFEAVTEPFSDGFMELIGDKVIKAYRTTTFYQTHADYFMQNKELSDEALTVVNENYYSRQYWSTIQPEVQLLSVHDRVAIELFNTSKKIAQVHAIGGLHSYFSDVKSRRSNLGYDSRTFQSVNSTNVPYDEAFLSYFQIEGDEYWAEHNIILSKKEIDRISSISPLANQENIHV